MPAMERTQAEKDARQRAADEADDLTADALRRALDKGKGSDKVPFPDPAAAPLGTDDEAGGTPPTPEQTHLAAAHELNRGEDTRPDGGGRGAALPIAIAAAVLFLVIGFVLVALP